MLTGNPALSAGNGLAVPKTTVDVYASFIVTPLLPKKMA
jgi:hypothetical protein